MSEFRGEPVTAGTEPELRSANLIPTVDAGTLQIWRVLNALLNEGVVAGKQPFVVRREVDGNPSIHQLLVDQLTVVAEYSTHAGEGLLARGEGTTAYLESITGDAVSVKVSATTMAAAKNLAHQIVARAPKVEPPDTVRVCSWYSNNGGARRTLRRIAAPRWREVANNYPPRVRAALAQVVSLERPANRGKLMLWHGEPGTGKTTAIRALIREWEGWCDAHYVADPERLFADTGGPIRPQTKCPLRNRCQRPSDTAATAWYTNSAPNTRLMTCIRHPKGSVANRHYAMFPTYHQIDKNQPIAHTHP